MVQKYILNKLGRMANQNLGIDFKFSDQSKLKYDSPDKNNRRYADSLEREMFLADRLPNTDFKLRNSFQKYIKELSSEEKQINKLSPYKVQQTKSIDTQKEKLKESKITNNQMKDGQLLEPKDDPKYNIAKVKFFGIDEVIPELYNEKQQQTRNFQSPIKNNILPNNAKLIERSPVIKAGNMIIRSQSVDKLIPRDITLNSFINPLEYKVRDKEFVKQKTPYYYSHFSMPKLPTINEVSRNDDSDVKSNLTNLSETLNKKKKIFATINYITSDVRNGTKGEAPRSLTLASSTDMSRSGIGGSPFVGRESDKYKDNTKESILKAVNNKNYHKKNDMSNYTYSAMTGRYY